MLDFPPIYVVLTVRFVQPEYTFEENSGVAEVCLVKEAVTDEDVTISAIATVEQSAVGKNRIADRCIISPA